MAIINKLRCKPSTCSALATSPYELTYEISPKSRMVEVLIPVSYNCNQLTTFNKIIIDIYQTVSLTDGTLRYVKSLYVSSTADGSAIAQSVYDFDPFPFYGYTYKSKTSIDATAVQTFADLRIASSPNADKLLSSTSSGLEGCMINRIIYLSNGVYFETNYSRWVAAAYPTFIKIRGFGASFHLWCNSCIMPYIDTYLLE